MKKIIFLLIVLYGTIQETKSQTYTATILIDTVHTRELNVGDSIFIPVRLGERSGGTISGFQIYIEFDHSIFKWNGSLEDPLPGVRNINGNIPYSKANWIFNDGGKQFVAIWFDATFKGQEIKEKDIIFEVVLTCIKPVEAGFISQINLGKTFEDVEGRLVRGVTQLYSEVPDYYVLKYIDGQVIIQ
jgi:hypothetical protein